MSQIRCKFCHKYIEKEKYSAHCDRHLEVQPDGQQTDYVTLLEEERFQDSLENVPQVYKHKRCGETTVMPEEIIRSYLEDPYLFASDETFCTGCNKHVPQKECFWVETRENLQEYSDGLRAAKPECRPGIFLRMLIFI